MSIAANCVMIHSNTVNLQRNSLPTYSKSNQTATTCVTSFESYFAWIEQNASRCKLCSF